MLGFDVELDLSRPAITSGRGREPRRPADPGRSVQVLVVRRHPLIDKNPAEIFQKVERGPTNRRPRRGRRGRILRRTSSSGSHDVFFRTAKNSTLGACFPMSLSDRSSVADGAHGDSEIIVD